MLTAFSSICRFFAGVEFAPHALSDFALVGSSIGALILLTPPAFDDSVVTRMQMKHRRRQRYWF